MSEERTTTEVNTGGLSALRRFAGAANVIGDRLALRRCWRSLTVALLVLVLGQVVWDAVGIFPAAASAIGVVGICRLPMGAAFMFGMPQTLRLGGHIRVNVLFDALKGRSQVIADILISAVSAVIMGMLAQALSAMAIRAFMTNSLSTASLTPLWIPQGALGLAAWLFTLQLAVRVVALCAGRPAEVPREYVGVSPE